MNSTDFIAVDSDFKTKVADSFNRQKFMEFINAKLVKVEPGYCEIELPFTEELTQQHGFFHAGIVATIADNAAGYAAFSLMEKNASVLTVEFKINMIAPAKGKILIGKAKVIKKGKTLTICQSEVFVQDEESQTLCAVVQATLIELKNKNDH